MDFLGKNSDSRQKIEKLLEVKNGLENSLKILDGFGLSIAANHIAMGLDFIQDELRRLKSF